jgi:hypothetical protein
MKTIALTALTLTITFAAGCAVRDAKMWNDDTSKVLASKQNDIKACYDDFLKGQPGAGGKVTVNFEVETDAGKIQKVTIDKANTTAPDALGDCVKKNIEGLVVSPPDSKVGAATYVYEFSQPPAPKS